MWMVAELRIYGEVLPGVHAGENQDNNREMGKMMERFGETGDCVESVPTISTLYFHLLETARHQGQHLIATPLYRAST